MVMNTVRWLKRMENGIGGLAINGEPYAVAELRDSGRLIGYRLARHEADGEVTYCDIKTVWQAWRCDCQEAAAVIAARPWAHPWKPGHLAKRTRARKLKKLKKDVNELMAFLIESEVTRESVVDPSTLHK